jgi:hypothetical protein
VEYVAFPIDSVEVPSKVEPSLNCTLPVGVPVPVEIETVAVNVTDWPYADGFRLEARLVVVLAWFTFILLEPPLLVLWFASPLYEAVTWVAKTDDGTYVAVHTRLLPEGPHELLENMPPLPSDQLTDPVGVLEPMSVSVTVAVTPVDWPTVRGEDIEDTTVAVLSWLIEDNTILEIQVFHDVVLLE